MMYQKLFQRRFSEFFLLFLYDLIITIQSSSSCLRKISSSACFCKLLIKLSFAMSSLSSSCKFYHVIQQYFHHFQDQIFTEKTLYQFFFIIFNFPPSYYYIYSIKILAAGFAIEAKLLIKYMRSDIFILHCYKKKQF